MEMNPLFQAVIDNKNLDRDCYAEYLAFKTQATFIYSGIEFYKETTALMLASALGHTEQVRYLREFQLGS